jgi:hypothetical protein
MLDIDDVFGAVAGFVEVEGAAAHRAVAPFDAFAQQPEADDLPSSRPTSTEWGRPVCSIQVPIHIHDRKKVGSARRSRSVHQALSCAASGLFQRES